MGEVNESVKEVTDLYNLEKFPTLMVLEKEADGSYSQKIYNGEMNLDDLIDYLKKYALDHKVSGKRPYKKG